MEYCQYLPQNFLIFIAPSLLFPNWWNVLRIYGGGQMEFSRREYKGDRTALEWLLLKSFPWETKMWEIRQKEIFKDLNKYCSALVEHFKDLIQRMSHFEVCTSYRLWRWCLVWHKSECDIDFDDNDDDHVSDDESLLRGVLQGLTMGWTFLYIWLHWPNRCRKYPEANKRIYSEKEIILVGLAWIKPSPLKKNWDIWRWWTKKYYYRWR